MERNWTAEDILDNGERVSHLNRDFAFYAHLSIYGFATQFCHNAIVLDVGSGSGYGSAHLAEHGAQRVYGIDASPKAVAFSRDHFSRPNLEYQVMPADAITGFSPQQFDIIFTSNVLEHVPDANRFFRSAWQLLKPTGTLIVAVPTIVNAELQYLNLINPYHVNIWSPRQWVHVIEQYFKDIQTISHRVGDRLGPSFKPEDWRSEFDETDFKFPPETLRNMYRACPLTSIFIVRTARDAQTIPSADSPRQFIDDSFTRPEGYIEPKIRWRLSRYFGPPLPAEAYRPNILDRIEKALLIARTQGLTTLLREAGQFIQYILQHKN